MRNAQRSYDITVSLYRDRKIVYVTPEASARLFRGAPFVQFGYVPKTRKLYIIPTSRRIRRKTWGVTYADGGSCQVNFAGACKSLRIPLVKRFSADLRKRGDKLVCVIPEDCLEPSN